MVSAESRLRSCARMVGGAGCVAIEGDHQPPQTRATVSHTHIYILYMLFGPRMRERGLNARMVAPNEFKSCRLPTRRVTGARNSLRAGLVEEKHERSVWTGDTGERERETCEFISWRFEEHDRADFTRKLRHKLKTKKK